MMDCPFFLIGDIVVGYKKCDFMERTWLQPVVVVKIRRRNSHYISPESESDVAGVVVYRGTWVQFTKFGRITVY